MISQVIHDLALEQENIAKEKGQEDDNFPGKRWLRRVNKLNVTESTFVFQSVLPYRHVLQYLFINRLILNKVFIS